MLMFGNTFTLQDAQGNTTVYDVLFSFEDAQKMLSEKFGFIFQKSSDKMAINSKELKILRDGFAKAFKTCCFISLFPYVFEL